MDFKKVFDDTKKNIGDFVDDHKEDIDNTTKGIENIARDVGNTVADNGSKLFEYAKNAGKNIVDQGTELKKQADEEYKKRLLEKKTPVRKRDLLKASFMMPNLIHIVESSKRNDSDIFIGSIGWIENNGKTNVFHLYNDSLNCLKINFFPDASSNCLYYLDKNNPARFVLTSIYIEEMNKEKFAELEDIAYNLGAVHYTLEIHDEQFESNQSTLKGSAAIKKGVKVKGDLSKGQENTSLAGVSIAAEATFSNSREPRHPELVWYKNDPQVLSLIKMRCNNDEHHMNNRRLTFDSTSSTNVSLEEAASIDATIASLGIKGVGKLKSKVEDERRKSLVFNIEFN